jgi:hypothetical protein
MATRKQNEKQFDSWNELENEGRIYKQVVPGKRGWFAVSTKRLTNRKPLFVSGKKLEIKTVFFEKFMKNTPRTKDIKNYENATGSSDQRIFRR